jgi:hypothetical protein
MSVSCQFQTFMLDVNSQGPRLRISHCYDGRIANERTSLVIARQCELTSHVLADQGDVGSVAAALMLIYAFVGSTSDE